MQDDELDLTGEQDATERMTELQVQQERADVDTVENERAPAHDGTVETEAFDVEAALEHL